MDLDGSEREEHAPGEHDDCTFIVLDCCDTTVDQDHTDLSMLGNAHADLSTCLDLLDYEGDPISLFGCGCDMTEHDGQPVAAPCNYPPCVMNRETRTSPIGWQL
jgi:hypothetical protein